MDNEFYSKGYEVVRNLIPKDKIKEQFERANKLKGSQYIDLQVPFSLAFYNNGTLRENHDYIHSIMEKVTGLKLDKTYYYWRKYFTGSILRLHTDRPACEYSVTICIGGDPWDIWLLDLDENAIKVNLEPGDGLIYKGCQITHWRGKFKGTNHIQAFYHFVDRYGINRFQKGDNISKGNLTRA